MRTNYDIAHVEDIHDRTGFVFILGRDGQMINEAWKGCPGWTRLLDLWDSHGFALDFALVTEQQLDLGQARELAASVKLPGSTLPEGMLAVLKRRERGT